MMNANVRRLVFDLSPRGYVWGQGFGWLLLAIVAAAGTSIPEHYSPGALLGLFASIWGWTCTSKFDLWQNLPIAIKELKLSQFLLLFVIPTILVITSNVFGGLITLILYNYVEINIRYIAVISCQLLTVISIGFCFYSLCVSSVFRRRFFVSLSFLVFLIIFVLSVGLTIKANYSQMIPNSMIAFGIIALLACLAALVWNQHLPLISPGKSYPSWKTRPPEKSAAARQGAYRPPGGRSGVWRLFASSIGRIAPYAGVALCLLALVVLTPKSGLFLVFDRPIFALMLAPLLCSAVAELALWEPQRVRGGLPVSALGRTFALQLVAPTFLLPMWGLIIALPALLRPDAMTSHWWILCGFTALFGLSFGAASVPASLRFGQIGTALLWYGFGAIVVGMISSQPGRFGERWTLEGELSLFDLTIIGTLVIILISGWIWTYLELALSRKAYLAQIRIPPRWRGADV